jgi:hypothetical protein
MIGPMYSDGHMMRAFTYGSSIAVDHAGPAA